MGTVQERLLDLIEEAGLGFRGGLAVVATFEAASSDDVEYRAEALAKVEMLLGNGGPRLPIAGTTKAKARVKAPRKTKPKARNGRAFKECASCGVSMGATAYSKGSDTCRACDKVTDGVNRMVGSGGPRSSGSGAKGKKEAKRFCIDCETVKPVSEFEGGLAVCRDCGGGEDD